MLQLIFCWHVGVWSVPSLVKDAYVCSRISAYASTMPVVGL